MLSFGSAPGKLPRRATQRERRSSSPLAAAAVAFLALAFAGCGSGAPTLDSATVERDVAASILIEHHLHLAVQCPTGIRREQGVVFTCMAKLDAGSYPVSVTETNRSGHVRYQNAAPLVILDIASVERSIERSILEQRHLRSSVTCPAHVLQQAGITFVCTATVNGQPHPFNVVEVDGRGRVRYTGS